jgi:DNA-binding transcriptional MerR regulator
MNPWPPQIDAHLRERLVAALDGRPTIRFAEGAKLLNLDQKTLRNLAEQGRIHFRIMGTGRRRLRREFTLSDLEDFYINAATRSAKGISLPAIRRRRPRVHGSFLTELEQDKRRTAT